MNTVAFVAKLTAKPETQDEVAAFLAGAVDLANQEAGTTVWFALRTDPTTFWIVDAFPGESRAPGAHRGPDRRRPDGQRRPPARRRAGDHAGRGAGGEGHRFVLIARHGGLSTAGVGYSSGRWGDEGSSQPPQQRSPPCAVSCSPPPCSLRSAPAGAALGQHAPPDTEPVAAPTSAAGLVGHRSGRLPTPPRPTPPGRGAPRRELKRPPPRRRRRRSTAKMATWSRR